MVHEKDFYASLHKGKTNLADMMKNVIFISPGLKISAFRSYCSIRRAISPWWLMNLAARLVL